MQLVIVESPAKAKTINKYLGNDFKVLASFGHIRDLPSKDGSVLPDEDFKMLYAISKDSEKHVREINHAAKGSERIYLATDPDREGEAISWHIVEAMKERGILGKKNAPDVKYPECLKCSSLLEKQIFFFVFLGLRNVGGEVKTILLNPLQPW